MTEYLSILIVLFNHDDDDQLGDVLARVKELDAKNEMLIKLLAKHTGRSIEELREVMRARDDVYLSAEEAKEWGLVDEIVESLQTERIDQNNVVEEMVVVVVEEEDASVVVEEEEEEGDDRERGGR
jgi:ClpP class serine protease